MSELITKPSHWTDEQWQAIVERGKNLLVAAAAGSGKTSVLVERIIRRITDPKDAVGVDQLLVVTFTNAAAAEMRHRIGDALRKALEEQPESAHLRRQLALLPKATITTLHSFCLGLLRQHYHAVDLDPDFRIADQMEAELLRQDVLQDQMEEWYDSNPAFQILADSMVDGQDDEAILRLLLRIYDFSRSHPDPDRWLMQAAEMFSIDKAASLDSLPWTAVMIDTIRLELAGALTKLQKAIELADSLDGPTAYLPRLAAEKEAVQKAREACDIGWEELQARMRSIEFGRLPAVRDVDASLKEQVQEWRNAVKDKVKKLLETYFAADVTQYLSDLQRTAPVMKTIAELVISFGEAYRNAKQERSIVDFGDLEHFALQVLTKQAGVNGQATEPDYLQPSQVAIQLREQFVEVLVDEYQDINLVQETILQMVSRDAVGSIAANRFMVGDVKQSIYRFRLAEPKLFLQKYLTYAKISPLYEQVEISTDISGDPGARIDLAANFRSRKEVVDAVNFLFRQIMSPGVGEIDYDQSAELIGRASYPAIESDQLDVEMHLIDRAPEGNAEGDKPESEQWMSDAASGIADDLLSADVQSVELEEASAAQLEARCIAKRIKQWLEPGEDAQPLLVYDKKTGGMRPLAYGDIVILLRATAGWGAVMQDELKKAGIPVYVEQSEGYFAATEVDVMLSLLRVLDNPLQDIPLTAVLRSPIVDIRDEQLAGIRVFTPNGPFHRAVQRYVNEQGTDDTRLLARLRHFFTRLDEWRTEARQGSLASCIARIYRDTGYVDYVASLENGTQRQANLRALYDRARQYEAASYRGLFRFLRFVDRLQEQGADLGEARTIGESEDVVRIMTIHKSKGLEFPVVFVAGLGKQFNNADVKSRFLLHKDLGFGPYVADLELGLQYPSLAHMGIKRQLTREMHAEEMRVLYVALTRAREKLILVGSVKNIGKSVSTWCEQIKTDGPLADEDVSAAKGYLDWIGRALVRHKGCSVLRDLAGLEQEFSLPLVQDESRWRFHLYQQSDLDTKQEEQERDEAWWEQVIRRLPVGDRPRDEKLAEQIGSILSWEYPQMRYTQLAAKWTVSELKHLQSEAMKDRESPGISFPFAKKKTSYASSITAKPRFLSDSATSSGLKRKSVFTSAEIGTIMHTAMQHLSLEAVLDPADVTQQVATLVKKEILTYEQSLQVNVEQISRFFASEVGQRMRHARQVHRELPFTLAIAADELLAGYAGVEPLSAEDKVIVQGVIDCLIEESDNSLILLDFKTDATYGDSDDALQKLADRYREQLALYTRAVERIWKRPVTESYLYSFSQGREVRIR